MIVQFLAQENYGWFKLSFIILIWLSFSTFLLFHYGLDFNTALIDSFISSLLLLLGLILLMNLFRFYLPTNANAILIFVFPLFLSLLIVWFNDLFLRWLLLGRRLDFAFLDAVLPVRGFVILLIYTAYSLILNLQGKLEEQVLAEARERKLLEVVKESELSQLRQQLQPNFLFNSLNSICALVKAEPDKARETVSQLSEFLRGTIKNEADKWISVAEEITFLKLFTDIEKVRFGHRLQVYFEIEDDIGTMKLPSLMVQPLLQNAIKHSLYGLIGDVIVEVEFKKVGKNIEVKISNPFDPKAGQANGAGFGLEAVNRRLFLVFGRYDLLKTYTSSQHFIVELSIPQLS